MDFKKGTIFDKIILDYLFLWNYFYQVKVRLVVFRFKIRLGGSGESSGAWLRNRCMATLSGNSNYGRF